MAECPELSAIAAELAVIAVCLVTLIFAKAIKWIAESSSGSSTYYRTPPETTGYGHDFKWVGHEAEQAYREKHWSSYGK